MRSTAPVLKTRDFVAYISGTILEFCQGSSSAVSSVALSHSSHSSSHSSHPIPHLARAPTHSPPPTTFPFGFFCCSVQSSRDWTFDPCSTRSFCNVHAAAVTGRDFLLYAPATKTRASTLGACTAGCPLGASTPTYCRHISTPLCGVSSRKVAQYISPHCSVPRVMSAFCSIHPWRVPFLSLFANCRSLGD